MRFGLLTEWFDPEPGPAALPGTLARGLVERGHQVQVLTGFPNYPTGELAPGYRIRPRHRETAGGVDILRVPLHPSHDATAASRLVTYGSFGASAATLGLGALRGLDALWVNYSPITVAPAMWLARHVLRVPLVVHVLDLWPDTLAASGVDEHTPAGRAVIGAAGLVARGMYASAHSVAHISPGVGPALQARGVPASKLHYAPMWADEQLFFPGAEPMRDKLGIPDDAVVLVYAGALGEAQGLHTLVEAAARVEDPRFVCAIAGSGTAEAALRDQAESLGTDKVRFLGRVAPTDMSSLLASADIAYVGLNEHPHARMTMPSKTQATLAAGRPLLVSGKGDVADVARASGAAWCVPAADVDALAEAMRQICGAGRDELRSRGDAARTYYEKTFSARTGIDTIEGLLREAADTRKKKP